MALIINIGDKVGFKVKGSINDENGVAQPFDFALKCKRRDTADIDAFMGGDYTEPKVIEFMVSVIDGWNDVKAADKTQIPYSEEAYRELCRIGGISYLSFKTYREEVGAKPKNS